MCEKDKSVRDANLEKIREYLKNLSDRELSIFHTWFYAKFNKLFNKKIIDDLKREVDDAYRKRGPIDQWYIA